MDADAENVDLLFCRPKKDRNAPWRKGNSNWNLFIMEIKRFLPSRPLCIRTIGGITRNKNGKIDV